MNAPTTRPAATLPAPQAQAGSRRPPTQQEAAVDLADTQSMIVCPECLAGKHDNCDGDGGFDPETDEPVMCWCWEEGHNI